MYAAAFALALMLWFDSSLAVSWYMAPTGAGTGTTDGTTTANMCDGPADASCQSPTPGDTVYLTGNFLAQDRFSVPQSGSSGNPIKYECTAGTTLKGQRSFNSPNGWSSTTGAYESSGHAWELVSGSGEIYKQTFGYGTANDLNWIRADDVLLTPTQHYNDSEATVVAALNRGEWTIRTSGKTVYIRMPSGAPPDSQILTANAFDTPSATRGFITISGKSYITIKNCDASNTAHGRDAGFYSVASTNTLLENDTCTFCTNGAAINGGSATIKNGRYNYAYDAGISVYADTPLSSLVIDGVEANYACFTGWFTGLSLAYSQDCDGIGIGEEGGTVQSIVIKNSRINYNGPIGITAVPAGYTGTLAVGAGISASTSNSMSVESLIITGNEIKGNFRTAAQINMGKYVQFSGNTISHTISGDYIAACTSSPHTVRIADLTAGGATRLVVNNNFDSNSSCATLLLRNTTALGNWWYTGNNIFSSNDSAAFTTDDRAEIWFEAVTANYTNSSNRFFNSQHNDDGEATRDYYRIGSTEYTAATLATPAPTDSVITAAPFEGGAAPTTQAGYCLQESSALNNTGTYFGAFILDGYGRPFDAVPHIGAMSWCRSRVPSPTRPASGARQ